MAHQLAHHALDGLALLLGDGAIAGGDIHDSLEEAFHRGRVDAAVETPEALVVPAVAELGATRGDWARSGAPHVLQSERFCA